MAARFEGIGGWGLVGVCPPPAWLALSLTPPQVEEPHGGCSVEDGVVLMPPDATQPSTVVCVLSADVDVLRRLYGEVGGPRHVATVSEGFPHMLPLHGEDGGAVLAMSAPCLAAAVAVAPQVVWGGALPPGLDPTALHHGRRCPAWGAAPAWDHTVVGAVDHPCVVASDLRVRFVWYQLLSAVGALHAAGVTHGGLSATTVRLSPQLWVWLEPPARPPPAVPRPIDKPLTVQWVERTLSTYDYLMAVNAAAGRLLSDVAHHPVLPWVTDFSQPNGGWRDLTRSKFRLLKGDSQLDHTFATSSPPHHLPEPPLTDLTTYMLCARRLPVDVLQREIRREVRPAEYPASMARLYAWAAEECIPELFTDACVLVSRHTGLGLGDVQLPEWCATPEAFIQYHRDALESDTVSATVHHWIDLTFGCLLSGEAATQARNVPLAPCFAARRTLPAATGHVQVFKVPHPPRQPAATPTPAVDHLAGLPALEFHVSTVVDDATQLAPVPLRPTVARSALTGTSAAADVRAFTAAHGRQLQPGLSKGEATPQADLRAVGSIMAALWLGQPAAAAYEPPEAAAQRLSALPAGVRHAVGALLSDDPPTAADAIAECLPKPPPSPATPCGLPAALSPATVLRPPPVFPSWFPALHTCLAALHAAPPRTLSRAQAAASVVGDVVALPVAALRLALPHFLALFGSDAPQDAVVVALGVWCPLAAAVGVDTATAELLPLLAAWYEAAEDGGADPKLVCSLVEPAFVEGVVACVTPPTFARVVLPCLTSLVQAGVSEVATGAAASLAAVAHPACLGPTLTVRLVIPSLLHALPRVGSHAPFLALSWLCRRVSVTAVVGIVAPRLMFLLSAALNDGRPLRDVRPLVAVLGVAASAMPPHAVRLVVCDDESNGPLQGALQASAVALAHDPRAAADALCAAAAALTLCANVLASRVVMAAVVPAVQAALQDIPSKWHAPGAEAAVLRLCQVPAVSHALSKTQRRTVRHFAEGDGTSPVATLLAFLHPGTLLPSVAAFAAQEASGEADMPPGSAVELPPHNLWMWGLGFCGDAPWWGSPEPLPPTPSSPTASPPLDARSLGSLTDRTGSASAAGSRRHTLHTSDDPLDATFAEAALAAVDAMSSQAAGVEASPSPPRPGGGAGDGSVEEAATPEKAALPAAGELVFVPGVDSGPSFCSHMPGPCFGGRGWRWQPADNSWMPGSGGSATPRRDFAVVSRSMAMHAGGVRTLAVGGTCESLLACGGTGNRVRAWSLDAVAGDGGSAPGWSTPVLEVDTSHQYVNAMAWQSAGQHLVVLGGGLSVWDTTSHRCLLLHEPSASPLVAMAPVGGVPADVLLGTPSPTTPVLAVASHASVSCVDLRLKHGAAGVLADWRPACGVDDWPFPAADGASTPRAADLTAGFGALQTVASRGYDVFMGSATGAAAVLDIRRGGVVRRWRAADAPLLKMFPLSGDRLMTVSAEGSALIWDAAGGGCATPAPDSLPMPWVSPSPHRRSAAGSEATGEAASQASPRLQPLFATPQPTPRVATLRTRAPGSRGGIPPPLDLPASLPPSPAATPLSTTHGIHGVLVASGSGVGFGNCIELWYPFGDRATPWLLSGANTSIGVGVVPETGSTQSTTWRIIDDDGMEMADDCRVKSLAVLPLRRLLVVATDDGELRVCA